ncbi:MAG: polyprenyl synthetase family protein [Ignavibacteriales bacterium]|nr:MAG: polyprenyl synthetase family protein [Ignavibacteriaceae bacterium]MBZ0196505.1 polyprenyl synthetase family protein [Ignavibacteriaceae bacterium]MCZ2142561.1 polyprenyl synthetase family protein [Ignavibacteriales bacterium]
MDTVLAPVKDGLREFNRHFKATMKSHVRILNIATSFILKQKGKKIRPTLVLLTAGLCGGYNERTFRGATMVELLHTATLVHDDVVDHADKRRGFPSINAIWKNKASVLIGDYLLARGLMLSVQSKDYDFLNTITETVKRMSEGELLQLEKSRKLDIDEETYFKVISDKTASLIETCCHVGAMSATDDPDLQGAAQKFGHLLGVAFQIKDDILDYEGSTKIFGKPIGGDIKEKKITLPLIYAMDTAGKEPSKQIIKQIKNIKRKDTVDAIIQFVQDNQGLKNAQEKAVSLANEAKECLAGFPDSEYKNSLLTLVDFVVNRKS